MTERILWTPVSGGNIQTLMNNMKVFETRKACKAYIDSTFTPPVIKFGNIKPIRINVRII